MQTSDFDYHLPKEQIAQRSVEPRDHSKLMIVDRIKKTAEHKHFFDIFNYLQAGDLLVWNNSKVFKARLSGMLVSAADESLRHHDKPIEIFLVRPVENPGVWQVLAKPGKHVQHGMRVRFADDFYADVVLKKKDGTILLEFPDDAATVRTKANQYGSIPIPPYVKDEVHEIEAYQTVYASGEKEGSVAAPTAGFHFTPELIEKVKAKGIQFAEVTLYVGLGTFLSVKSERIEDHTMHSEWVEVSEETAQTINQAKREGRRVIAVGTTTVRTLEGVHMLKLHGEQGVISAYEGDINMFITPGFTFGVVDALITNFHLPKSTLLMLVSAFIGDTEFTLSSYKEAVEKEYRFFSFGDAMFIV